MSTSPNHEMKKEPIDNDEDIEILSEISNNNVTRNNVINSTSFAVKSEFNNQTESKKDEKIKQLEQMQKILMETVQIKTNEIEKLKHSETNLIATITELNNTIEIYSNNYIDLSNEITSLKADLLEAKETIEIIRNENEILKKNETNLIATNTELYNTIEINSNNHIDLSNEITSLKEELFKAKEIINTNEKNLLEEIAMRKKIIEIYIPNKAIKTGQITCSLNDPLVNQATCQSMELTQKSQEHLNLELNLNKLNLLVDNLINFETQSFQDLNKHCQKKKYLVRSATLQKIKTKPKKRKFGESQETIDKINKSSEELIQEIDNYQVKCIKEFSNKISAINELFSKLVNEADKFIEEANSYLNLEVTNDDEIKRFNLESIELQSKLNSELKKQKYLIFNNKKI